MTASGATWDYLVERDADGERIAALGREGWELVSVVVADGERTLYFKRPALDFRERVTLDQKRRCFAALGKPVADADGSDG